MIRVLLPAAGSSRLVCHALLGVILLGVAAPAEVTAQRSHDRLPIRPARTIAFETTEGTAMNVDVSPDGRMIAFDLLGDIYSVPISGGVATQLTRGLGYDRWPVWSPDGTQIAYVSDATGAENLWLMAADGTNSRPVAAERKHPVSSIILPSFTKVEWAPDGQSLVSDDTVFHLAGGKRPILQPLTGEVRFSPDGRYAYFWREGVRRYDRQTGETIQLAHPPVDFSRPVVSPDGRWLAYITRGGSDRSNGLRIRNLVTGEDRWLTYPIDERRGTYERYVFTPDSRAVLIGYSGKLHRIDVTTGEDAIIPFTARVQVELGPFVHHRHRVTNDSLPVRYIRSPAVSPDGRTLVFSALQRLYIMALPRGTPKPLVTQPYGQFQPAYSPDGKWIAYVTWSGAEGGHVWRVPTTGGRPKRLTSVAGYYQRPAWSPDGTTLAILSAGTKDARPANTSNGWLQLLPSSGGTPRTVLAGVSRATPVTFTPDGQRLLVQEGGHGDQGPLVMIRLDGRDRRVLARVASVEPWAWPLLPSPDGRYVAYIFRSDLYVARLPGLRDTVTLGDSTGAVPVGRLAHEGLDPRWDQESRTLMWVSANEVSRVNPDHVIAAAWGSPPEREAPSMALSGKAAPTSAATSAARALRVAPDEVIPIRLAVPRYVARGILALRGARVITMKGDEVFENATVVIRNDRIIAVGPASSVVIPAGAKVLDMGRKTIMPGLVDLHAHFTWREDESFLQHDWPYLVTLAYGVTTTRDPARNTPQFGDAELIETGQMLGPRLFSVGSAISTTRVRIESLEDAHAAVQYRKAMGAVVVKQYGQRTRRQRQWVLQAAAEAGLNVTNEAGHSLRESLELIFDGTTGVEHGIVETSLYSDVTRLIAEAKTWYTPTLMVGKGSQALEYFRERYRRLYNDPKYRRFVPQDGVLEDRRSGLLLRPGDSRYHDFVDVARPAATIVHRGGHVTIGSHGEDQGLGVHWELWALQMGGLTPHEALRAGTLHGAEGLGVEQDLGSLEVGKLADLLVLDKNPLEQIEHTLSIRYVMKNGILYNGETLNTVWPVRRTLPAWMYEEPPKANRAEQGRRSTASLLDISR